MNAARASLTPSWFGRLLAGILAVGLAATVVLNWPGKETVRVTAEFSRAVGLFKGSDVRILGVKVGEVLSVTPAGEKVRVEVEWDAAYKVPADAKAVVVAPSLVSDRFVQLAPVYRGGPAMATGARIGLDRTAVPVELDRISSSLDDLMKALGPDGANKDGALSRLIDTSAANLDGQGSNIRETTANLAQAVQTLAEHRGDLFGTVRNLQDFTTMLAQNDKQVRRLNADLASVSEQLDAERDELAEALRSLAVALSEISTFVKDNRDILTQDVAQLTRVTGAVAKERDALAETLTNAPVAISNLGHAYNPRTGTLDTRVNLEQLQDPALLLCSLLSGPTGNASDPVCKTLEDLLSVLPELPPLPGLPSLPQLPGSAVPQGTSDNSLAGLLGGAS